MTDELSETLVHTRDTLVVIVERAWQTDFLQADLEAIRTEKVLERVKAAQQAANEDDLDTAMGWLRSALEYAFEAGGDRRSKTESSKAAC